MADPSNADEEMATEETLPCPPWWFWAVPGVKVESVPTAIGVRQISCVAGVAGVSGGFTVWRNKREKLLENIWVDG